jgi:uncharacterized lipoprotein YddW (UPF0748 family)
MIGNLKNTLTLLCLLYTNAFGSPDTFKASTNFKAAWLPSSYRASNQSDLCGQLAELEEVGITRVYIDVWNQGKVYWASDIMANKVGASSVGTDRLLWASECASRLEIYAWFEYGLMASYGSLNNPFSLFANSSGWILGQSSGFFWLDVNSPALNFLSELMKEVAVKYPGINGLQLDDHFAQPAAISSVGILGMTEKAKWLCRTVRKALPDTVHLSLSPSDLAFAQSHLQVNWKVWSTSTPIMFDEYVPQLYRSSFSLFSPLLTMTKAALVRSKADIGIGLRIDGSGDPTPWSELVQMIHAVQNDNLSPSLWYSRGVLELYRAELTKLFH